MNKKIHQYALDLLIMLTWLEAGRAARTRQGSTSLEPRCSASCVKWRGREGGRRGDTLRRKSDEDEAALGAFFVAAASRD
jgi:hypothetical protein